jgi:hypothetical protein
MGSHQLFAQAVLLTSASKVVGITAMNCHIRLNFLLTLTKMHGIIAYRFHITESALSITQIFILVK